MSDTNTPTNTNTPRDMAQMDERRSAPRVHVEVELHLTSASNFWVGYTFDISEGGLFVQTYTSKEEVGDTVSLELALPGGFAFHAEGVVRWVREPAHPDDHHAMPPGIGVQFVSLLPEQRNLIQRFLANRLPDFYDAD